MMFTEEYDDDQGCIPRVNSACVARKLMDSDDGVSTELKAIMESNNAETVMFLRNKVGRSNSLTTHSLFIINLFVLN